jgi:RNA polymerase-binding transcription factor DksA
MGRKNKHTILGGLQMPIKTINEMLDLTNSRQEKKIREQSQDNIKRFSQQSSMKQVVPPLHRGDFLGKWQDDRKQLEQVRKEKEELVKENNKLKKIMNTTYSNTWGQYVETTKKK